MKTTWKFPFVFTPDHKADVHIIEMPKNARIIFAGEDTKTRFPAFWAEADDASETEKRKFCIVGTGEKIPDTLSQYIGSARCGNPYSSDKNIVFMWHIYEVFS